MRNEPLVELIGKLGQNGLSCYLATEQENNRARYMRGVMFKGLFKGHFATCDLGTAKSDPRFYETVIEELQTDQPALTPRQVAFFDDSPGKVDAARSVSISVYLYPGGAEGVAQVNEVLADWLD